MTDPTQGLKDDIAFLRGLTQDSDRGLAREAATLVTVGAIFGIITFVYWLLFLGLLGSLRPVGYWLWLVGVVLMIAISARLKARMPRSSGAASRAMETALGGAGVALTAACGGLIVGGSRLGNPGLVLWIFPIVLFTLYGAAWSVAYAAKRRGWFGAVAAGCFLTAGVEGALVGTPHQWLVLSLGLIAWVAAPGVMLLRQTRGA